MPHIAKPFAPDEFDEYYRALGNFVDEFSQVEAALQELLWKLANVSKPTAQAVFSGVRTDGALQYIGRIADAQKWGKSRKDAWQEISSHIFDLDLLPLNAPSFG